MAVTKKEFYEMQAETYKNGTVSAPAERIFLSTIP